MTSIKVWLLAIAAAAGTVSARAQQTNQVDPKSFEAFKIITERNIFDPNRRPPRGPFTPPPTPQIVDSFSLTGTMSYEKGNFAVFDGNKSDYRAVLEAGSKIAGYTLNEICHDLVKISSGTNQVELKVGMQMRRSEDGKWSATEQAADYSASSNQRNNFARNNRNGGDRNDRNGGGNSRMMNLGGGRNNNFRNENSRNENNRGDRSDRNEGNRSGQGEADGAQPGGINVTTEAGNLDLTDPVQRLMMRRLLEVGGDPNQNTDGDRNNQGADRNRDADENREPDQNNTNDNPNPAPSGTGSPNENR